MNILKTYFGNLLVFMCPVYCFAHSLQDGKDSIGQVRLGEMVPGVKIGHIKNYQESTALLSDFQGKFVILDFWGVNCAPCVAAIPRFYELQQQFKGKLIILMVCDARQSWIDSTLAFRKKRYGISYPPMASISSDTVLSGLFPHKVIPHEIWINQKGQLVGITDEKYVTKEHLTMAIEQSIYPMDKKEDQLTFKPDKAALPQILDSTPNALTYYSCILPYKEGLWGGTYKYIKDSSKYSLRLTRVNRSILSLYGDALTRFRIGDPFESPQFDYGKRVVLLTDDSSRFFPARRDDLATAHWKLSHLFTYEEVIPIAEENRIFDFMVTDLNRYFNISGSIEKRTMRCLAIIRTSTNDKIRYNGSDSHPTQYIDGTGAYHLIAANLRLFRDQLTTMNKSSPFVFIDKTGYSGKVNVDLDCSLNNLPLLRQQLRTKYDLDLVEVNEEVEVMVLKDNNIGQSLTSNP